MDAWGYFKRTSLILIWIHFLYIPTVGVIIEMGSTYPLDLSTDTRLTALFMLKLINVSISVIYLLKFDNDRS